MWCIHTIVLIRLSFGRNPVAFYQTRKNPIKKASEIDWPVNTLQWQYLIYWYRCQHKHILSYFCEFITPASADGLSQESGRQQVSSGLEDSSRYSGRSQEYCSLDGHHSSSDFQIFQLSFQTFLDRSKRTNLTRYVIYWPKTELSVKRCTCVNKRKNSGSRWMLENNITRCLGGSSSVGDRMPKWEPAVDRGLWALSYPRLSNPSQERSAAMVERRTWVNIAVRPCLHSFLTHNKHHLFENKVWEIYIKKCIRSLLKSFIIG